MNDLIKQVQEACADVCDAIEKDRFSLYKGRPPYTGREPGRADHYVNGESDGAGQCAGAIRALDLSHLTGWQDISTAPKDGTVIILFGCGRVTAGHWEPERWPVAAEYHGTTGEYLGQHETGECIPAWWYSEDGGFAEDSPPTHWMPLPAPPKPSK